MACGSEATENSLTSHRIRIRTSSHILKLSSSTFRAMLGPHFKEGKSLGEYGSVEIELPEDDPQTMTTMCKVMHHNPDIMHEPTTALDLANLAHIADKYDTVRALGPSTSYLINKVRDLSLHGDLALLLGVAGTFGHTTLFNKIGKDIVMGCGVPMHMAAEGFPEVKPVLGE